MRAIVAFLLVAFAGSACAAAGLNHQLDNVIKRIKGADASAVEYRKARTTHFIDVDQDGVKDALVFFTIEGRAGGNNYEQYLTVFKGAPSGFKLLDTALIGGGALGAASYEPPTVNGSQIVIQRSAYADEDSRCCPSIKTSITLAVKGSRLVSEAK